MSEKENFFHLPHDKPLFQYVNIVWSLRFSVQLFQNRQYVIREAESSVDT